MQPLSGFRILLVIFFAFNVSAQTFDEYQVKAAFIYNFVRFVEWPALTFKTDKDPVRICVLGQNPFGGALKGAIDGKIVLGRSLVVTDISDAGQPPDCQILFIGSLEWKHRRPILAALQTPGVLTVGETDGFATQGGIVNFKLEDGRVRLEINVEAAGRARLRISSRVLSLAQIVNEKARK
jgi:hypothetical protein